MQVIEFKDDFKKAWDIYVERSDKSTIAHRIGWMKVMHRGLGHHPRYLMAFDNDKITGVLPLVIVKTIWGARYAVSLPWIDYGGICADNSKAERALMDEARKITDDVKASFLELRSIVPLSIDYPARGDKATFIMNLSGDPEDLWKGFDAKLRNQIRKSQKSGLETEFAGKNGLNDFYKVFSWKMHNLGTPVWGRKFFENILEEFPGTAELALVKKEGSVVAGGLVLSFKDRLYVPSAAAYNHALKFCPNHALYWETIKRGCELGFKYFDFGRSARDSNTFRFKKQWVPQSSPLVWQYYLNSISEIPSINPANPRYRFFINAWRRLPLGLANYLGPRIIRNFP